MSKLLIIFNGDWADEMDVDGFMIVSKECWKYKQLEWEHTSFPQELYIGTNESMEYENMEEYLRNFKVKDISDEEEKVIRTLFGLKSKFSTFGQVPFIEGDAPDSFYEEHGYCPD